eukprot:GHVT01087880.1.p1 GENE.GHVT01087880.1~~GHVT01087880.1.p1  ORF type:complete len:162 (-),score=16.58 GHVT01087880.1:831-1316(-)
MLRVTQNKRRALSAAHTCRLVGSVGLDHPGAATEEVEPPVTSVHTADMPPRSVIARHRPSTLARRERVELEGGETRDMAGEVAGSAPGAEASTRAWGGRGEKGVCCRCPDAGGGRKDCASNGYRAARKALSSDAWHSGFVGSGRGAGKSGQDQPSTARQYS